MTAAVRLCIAAGLAAGVCHAEGSNLPAMALVTPPPEWATRQWIHDAAGIVAGETVPGCATCDQWIACAVVEDVTERGYHPWRLRPGRWHGWKRPEERHLAAIREALGPGGCADAPVCAFLGNWNDYIGNWRFGLARERQVLVIGNRHGALTCVPLDEN